MKYIILALLLAASAVHADDHVTIKYTPGHSMSGKVVKITITRPIDNSGTLIQDVFQRLEAISKLQKGSFVIPSAAFVTISAEMDGRRLEASSCHTLFESNPNLVATSNGVRSLKGMAREAILLEEPKDFMEFRRLWEESLSMSMKSVTGTILPQQRDAERR